MLMAERVPGGWASHYDYFSVEHVQGGEKKIDSPRFLLIPPIGIGDAVAVGSSTADQIIKNDPTAYGKIDVLCNNVQAELFQHDPRINSIIRPDPTLLPTMDRKTWMKAIFLDSRVMSLLQFLRERDYEAVLPGIMAPGFYAQLRAPLMAYDVFKIAREVLSRRASTPMHISSVVRKIVNNHFGIAPLQHAMHYEDIPLYMSAAYVQKAKMEIECLKRLSIVPTHRCKVILVAPDTTSVVTRVPTYLLATGISAALRNDPDLTVGILPGYTDTSSSANLLHMLSTDFAGRVTLMRSHPRPTLLETTALIDQANVFVTGDTGVMHLAAAIKKSRKDETREALPANSVKMIALFGGTNPWFYGYSTRSIILGRGRKEQEAFRPGIIKEYYNPKGKDFFDHIAPQELTENILAS